MMRRIYFKAEYGIRGKIDCDEPHFDFTVPIGEGVDRVKVRFIPKSMAIKAQREAEVSDRLLEILRSGEGELDADELSTDAFEELYSLRSPLSRAARRVVSSIKYFLGRSDLGESLYVTTGNYWSEDGGEWKRSPRKLTITTSTQGMVPLNNEFAECIQGYLNEGREPFVALQYLHFAREETNVRQRWISATIAAELAVKEFLIARKADLAPLLLELPSPPLGKLYGSILEHYAGQRSPMRRALIKGVEIRNRLIHRPCECDVSVEQAIEYVGKVEQAIYHLLSLLHPGDPIIGMLYCG